MEIVGHLGRPAHHHRGREQRVDAAHPGRGRAHRAGVEVRHLRARMHAGVGAPGAVGAHRLAGDLRERALEHVLHGASMSLALPAAEGVSGVLEAEHDALHARLHQSRPAKSAPASRPSPSPRRSRASTTGATSAEASAADSSASQWRQSTGPCPRGVAST